MTMTSDAKAPPRMILSPAPEEGDAVAGAWVVPGDDPAVGDISRGMSIASVLAALKPDAFRGRDRLRFVSNMRADAGNLVIEHDSVPVEVQVDREGHLFVLLGGDERFPVPVAPMRWAAGESLQEARERLVAMLRRRAAADRRHAKQVAARERVGMFGVPSETAQLLALPVTQADTKGRRLDKLAGNLIAVPVESAPDIRGARRVIGGRVTIELDPESRRLAADSRKRKGRKTAQAVLPFDQVSGDADNLVPMAWQVLQHLNPDALLTLLAGLSIAGREGGVFPAAPSRIGHERNLIGNDGLLDKARRRELVEQLGMLQQVHLLVTPYGGGGQDRLRLLVPQGERKLDGMRTPVPLLAVNMVLWERMRRGRELVLDKRVLTFQPRNDEWALRLYWQFAVRWNLGWVGQGLRKTGGTVEAPLAETLDRSGLQWRDQLQARGQQWVLEKVERALDTLRQVAGGPMAMIELVGDGTVSGSRLRGTPPATLAEQLTSRRQGAIEMVDRVEVKTAKTKRRTKRKAVRKVGGNRARGRGESRER